MLWVWGLHQRISRPALAIARMHMQSAASVHKCAAACIVCEAAAAVRGVREEDEVGAAGGGGGVDGEVGGGVEDAAVGAKAGCGVSL